VHDVGFDTGGVGMNECPTCGRYIRGDVCPYCEEELLDSAAGDASPVAGESLVPVYSCDEQWQADFILSALEAEGIPAYKVSAEAVGQLPPNEYAVEITGDIVVTVEEDDAERALEVIESVKQDLEAEET